MASRPGWRLHHHRLYILLCRCAIFRLLKSSTGRSLADKNGCEGHKEWDRTYGGLGKDLGFFVQQTKDEGYIIVGGKKSFWIVGNYDLWIIKTDAKGNVLWDRTFGGSGEDLGFSVQQTNDDGYIIAGYTSFTNGKKAWIIKIDSQGNKQLDMATGRADSEAASIGLTKDGGYIIRVTHRLQDQQRGRRLIDQFEELIGIGSAFGGPNGIWVCQCKNGMAGISSLV